MQNKEAENQQKKDMNEQPVSKNIAESRNAADSCQSEQDSIGSRIWRALRDV